MEEFIKLAMERANLLSNHARVFPQWQGVQNKFLEAVEHYKSNRVDHSRAITEFYNEVIIALDICAEGERLGWSLEYEPVCPNGRSIDFCITKNDGARIYVDVKTVHPQNKDAVELYNRCLGSGLID